MNAAGCLIELYRDADNDSSTATLIDGAKAFTNINGEYKIPYYGNEKNALRLKFYNNEDVLSEFASTNPSILGDTANEITTEVVNASGNYSEGEWFEVITETNRKIYEYVSNTSESGKVNASLVSWVDESTPFEKLFYRRVLNEDNNKYYRVLDKKVVYYSDGKARETYTRIPENVTSGQLILHNHYIETYNSYWSPQLVTSNQEEEINYLFENNTLDEYSRIINREEELISASNTADSTTPARSLIKGYSAEETPFVASLIGVSEEDVQNLSQARDFKSQMRLEDHEAILFGLVNKGVKLDVAVFFSMSDNTLRAKIQEAIDDRTIPTKDITKALEDIRTKLLDVVSKEFTEVFTGIESDAVKAVMADATKKDAFIKTMAQFSYENTDLTEELEGDFWLALPFDVNEEVQLKLAIQYSEVCNANEKFVNRFLDAGSLKPFSELLKMNRTDIIAKINEDASTILASDDMPEGITTAEAYANFIYNQIEDKFATESLLFDLAQPNVDFAIEGETNLTTMFNALRVKLIDESMSSSAHFYGIVDSAGSTFDIEKGPVRDFLKTTTVDNALSTFYSSLGAYTKEDFINFLTTIQRVYSITSEGKYDTIKALIDNAYLSAYDIVKAGRKNFINKMNAILEDEVCLKLYRTAEYKVNKALAILNKYSGSANSGMPVIVKDKKLSGDNKSEIQLLSLPEMSILFGDQDVTNTKHGESVLGPAAYLVDVLNVLKQFKVSDTENEITLYDKLIKRRPDIAEIPLNCTNALTPLPYIDLVMEILENAIYHHENGNYSIDKWDTTKTAEQLKTDPEYTQYSVYDKIKKNTITSWLSKPFDLFSEELKLFGKALGINRTKLAEPYYKMVENAVNPYFDVLGMTSEEQVLFPENPTNTNTVLDFVFDSVFGVTPNPAPTKLPVKGFIEKSVMTLDEFNTLIDSYYVNPYVTDGENYQRFTIHYSGKQELSTAFLDFGSTDRLKAFLMRMFQFRRLMILTEWSTPVLDAILLLDPAYKAYYKTINSNNQLITFAEVERIGYAKMKQEYLGLSDNQVACIFGKAVVLEYNKTTSFINQNFIDNNLPKEHKETLTEWLTIGNESGVPLNAAAYNSEGEAHVFMEYLQEAMNLTDEELLALSSFLEQNTDKKPKLTARGVQNMITAWQLAEGYGLKIEEFLAYCKLIQFDVTTALVDSVETLSNVQKTVIANQTNVMELLFLLQHHGSAEELEEFEKRAKKIVANILDKKDEFSPVLEEDQQMSQEQKDALALALQPVIEEQLNITTKLELPFVSKVLEQKSIDGKDLANYTADPGTDETSVVETKLLTAIKSCLKSLSLSEEMNINLEDLTHIDSSPVNIFNLPMDSEQAVSYEDFAKLAAVCQAKQFLLDGKNGFDFYNQILSTDKANLALSNYIDWHAILTDWQHNDELETNKYNSNLKWFLQAGEINQFLNRYGIQSADALKLIKWNWTDLAEAEQSVKSIAKLAQEKANAAVYKAEMSAGRNQLE